MNPHEAWSTVLGQLQMEMARAAFDTRVRDTKAVSLEEGLLTIATHSADARDWLESHLTSTVQRLLIGILNQAVTVQFVVRDFSGQETESEEQNDEQEVVLEAVQWLDYDRIVQPHKQVVVKGYLRRLGMEIGPKAIWLYIGFHQAAWRVHSIGKESGMALHSREVMRFSGLSFGAFWRSLRNKNIQSQLTGLVQRLDPPHERKYHRGRDGRPHRIPIRYQVFMTPRLTRSDSVAVYSRLKTLTAKGTSMVAALQELLAVEDVMDLLVPTECAKTNITLNTVMDMARLEMGQALTPEVDHLAQELQRRIIGVLGDIHITHYFIMETIRQFKLTPAQAWLVTVARDMAYLNARTGERREVVTFQQGYLEMAALIGSSRYKTVQAWFNPHWISQMRGGDLRRFLFEIEPAQANTYPDLRVASMPRTYRALLDEPLDATGSHMKDADGNNSQAHMAALADASGSHMLDAHGTVLNSFKHSVSTYKNNTSTTPDKNKTAGGVPQFWKLESLLRQNAVHPKVQRELLQAQASVQAFISWVLFVASPQSGNLSDPLGYAISRLRADPLHDARGVFQQFASLPPAELLALIDASLAGPYELRTRMNHPLAPAWTKAMGSNHPILPVVRGILFGEGEIE